MSPFAIPLAVENYLEFLADVQARRGEAVGIDKGSRGEAVMARD